MKKVQITIKEEGKTDIVFTTDSTGAENAQDVINEIINIVGERPLRKKKRF